MTLKKYDFQWLLKKLDNKIKKLFLLLGNDFVNPILTYWG
jgi:hypothetical protein